MTVDFPKASDDIENWPDDDPRWKKLCIEMVESYASMREQISFLNDKAKSFQEESENWRKEYGEMFFKVREERDKRKEIISNLEELIETYK